MEIDGGKIRSIDAGVIISIGAKDTACSADPVSGPKCGPIAVAKPACEARLEGNHDDGMGE